MQISRKVLLLFSSLILLIPSVLANANVTFYSAVTFTGVLGLRVPLGFEQVVPLNWAMMCYNALSIGFIIFVAGFGSRYSVRYTLMTVDGFAAIFWWFGWMSFYNADLNAINYISPLNLIILAAILSGAIYLKEANKESSGPSGGGGLTLLNILYWFVLLQTAIGLVNVTGIWGDNASVTPSAWQYGNTNLDTQITQQNNIGGITNSIINDATALTSMVMQSGNLIFQILNGISGYAGVLTNAFPWIAQSAPAMAFVDALSIIILLLDAWFVFLIITKPPPIDNLNPG